MTEVKKRSDCPISQSLDIWGDRWSLLIVRDLMLAQQCTYGDFQKSKERIASNILATRLQMLEENGIITKSDHPQSKAKVLYKLTQKGIDLLPVMMEIQLWADKYFMLTDERRAIVKDIKKDKAAFLKNTTRQLEEVIG